MSKANALNLIQETYLVAYVLLRAFVIDGQEIFAGNDLSFEYRDQKLLEMVRDILSKVEV